MNQCEEILTQIKKAFVGKKDVARKILMTMLAGGHVLLEDIPGVGKTTLAVAFSNATDLQYKRIQFTPDVLPSDITGFSIFHRETGAMEYQPGAAICNLLLADEINRASSRTQSALLEAMEEGSVTVDGVTHLIPQPFTVIATQNPTGSAGTQLLPDSQLDRFMMRLSIGYPEPAAEREMLRRKHGENHGQAVRKVADAAALLTMRDEVSKVFVHESCMTISSALPAPHVSINRSGRAQAPAVQWRQWRLRRPVPGWMGGIMWCRRMSEQFTRIAQRTACY